MVARTHGVYLFTTCMLSPSDGGRTCVGWCDRCGARAACDFHLRAKQLVVSKQPDGHDPYADRAANESQGDVSAPAGLALRRASPH
eukprot:21052-Pyramimonas_sp.AAC.1